MKYQIGEILELYSDEGHVYYIVKVIDAACYDPYVTAIESSIGDGGWMSYRDSDRWYIDEKLWDDIISHGLEQE